MSMNAMTKKAVRRRLMRAREIVERGWAKGTLARKGGHPVYLNTKDATNYCLLGAVQKALIEIDNAPIVRATTSSLALDPETKYLNESLGYLVLAARREQGHAATTAKERYIQQGDASVKTPSVINFNDHTSKARVLKVLDRAIESLA